MACYSRRGPSGILKNTADFAFLEDTDTVTSLPSFRVMVVMRGLPGSGKTTLVEAVQRKYASTTVCSANAFFYKNGEYVFDGRRLVRAHEACKQNAASGCKAGHPLVVIDNTNVELWEMGYYLDLARRYKYIPVLVSPRTPWALDPNQLAQRTRHAVPQRNIEKKLASFHQALPLFYAWFLRPEDSETLWCQAKLYFDQCIERAPPFRNTLKRTPFSSGGRKVDIWRYYNKRSSLPHCTCYYIGSNTDRRHSQYSSSDVVQSSTGKVSTLYVIGFVFTHSTVSARVALTEDELQLWGQTDSQQSPRQHSSPLELLDSRPKFAPVRGRGDSAHITLGVSGTTPAAQAGTDLRALVALENNPRENPDVLDDDVRVFRSGHAVVYLDSPIPVLGLFSGEYQSVPRPDPDW